MRKKIIAFGLSVVLTIYLTVPCFAAATYSGTIALASTTASYTMLPVITSLPTAAMVSSGFITQATGLDTAILNSGAAAPHMLADDKVIYAMPVTQNAQPTVNLTTGNAPASAFNIVTGYNGLITCTPSAVLWSGVGTAVLEWKQYLDFSAGNIGKNILTYNGAGNYLVYYKSATTLAVSVGGVDRIVTAPALSSSEKTIKLTMDMGGNTTVIEINGVSYGSWADVPGAVGVAPLVLGDATADTIPYMTYFTCLATSGSDIHFHPDAIISGTTLPDKNGGNENGTITWGSNPAGVTATLSDFQPVSKASANTSLTSSYSGLVNAPTATPDIYADMQIDNSTTIPGAEVAKEILDAGQVPTALFWFIVATLLTCGVGLWVKKITSSMLWQGIAMIALSALWAFTVLPQWTLYAFAIESIAIMFLQAGPYRI